MTLRILRIDLPSKEELVRFMVREPAGSEGVFPSLEDLHIFMPSLLDADAARRLRYIDQSDLYRVLNLVARTRCRRSPQSDLGLIPPSNTLFPLSAHPNTPAISRCTTATTLKSFRLEFWSYLTFSGPRGCTVHEKIESAWEREDSFYSSSSSAWWEELATLEPWLEFLRIFILVESRGQSVVPLADALHWREKDRKFRQFEALEIVDLKSLYISGLHRVLRELLDLRFFYREVEQRFNQYHFRERIRAILDKWAPRFQEDLPNRHWHLCHKQILAYVAEDDPIRKDPDALKIIYGPYNTDHNSESRELWNAEKPHLSYCRPLITNHWASNF
ncbi:hypothetical protein NLJ89_g8490 [Agrocybe chaxingu]|uniref:Uncharacterized protein n=1 Tax=Agrocybe chaxingu TaxID=84603 RepID=A0A9W8JUK2_9AGAR|nr:hypothetical protein NLJ89_g8490 [Agrocybe chaxingu]